MHARGAFLYTHLHSVMAAALQHCTRMLYTATDDAFTALVRPETPWSSRDRIDDRSPWVDLLASALESVGVVVRHQVENKRHVRSWCDRAATLVGMRITQSVLRLRPLRQRTAQQLQADTAHVRTLLLELPHFSSSAGAWGSQAPAMQSAYQRIVDKSLRRIEQLLQVLSVASDESPSVRALVESYREHVGDQSLSNFQKVLDLKVGVSGYGMLTHRASGGSTKTPWSRNFSRPSTVRQTHSRRAVRCHRSTWIRMRTPMRCPSPVIGHARRSRTTHCSAQRLQQRRSRYQTGRSLAACLVSLSGSVGRR